MPSSQIENQRQLSPRHHRTAQALLEVLFPPGEHVPAPDSQAVVEFIEDRFLKQRWSTQAIAGGLDWLEYGALVNFKKGFSKAGFQDRQNYVSKKLNQKLPPSPLSLLVLMFKVAYLELKEVKKATNSINRVQVPSQIEHFRWQQQAQSADHWQESQDLEADVVVIGTGAGGAAAAYELASQGHAVLILEEGAFFTRQDFNGDVLELVNKLVRYKGGSIAVGNHLIPVPTGRCVGGTTTINSGTCMRTPPDILARWQAEGLSGLGEETLNPLFSEVEEILKVQPAAERYVGEIGQVIKQGAEALGLSLHHPLMRNAEGCDGQGLCQFGCPTDAKQSTNVSYIPRALQAGTFLYSDCRAEKLLWRGNSITGLEARSVKTGARLTIHCDHVVVAAGTLATPQFLRRNGIKHPLLGTNLSIHPAGVVMGYYPDRYFNHGQRIPQGFGVADLQREGILFEGGTPPLLGHGLSNSAIGQEYVDYVEQYQHTGYFGFMIRDDSRGRVRSLPYQSLPLISYRMNRSDFSRFLVGVEYLVRMHLRAGAEHVRIGGIGLPLIKQERQLEHLLSRRLKPRDFLITAYHPLGTAAIGANIKRGVCDQHHKVFGKQGLYVMDGSSVPSSLGANPQVTIMALATKAARELGKAL